MSKFEKLKRRWEELAYWQKGAIIGGGLHIGIILLIVLAALLFVPRTAPPGSGDQGTALAWILFIFYGLIEFVPVWSLYLITGKDLAFPGRNLWIWFLFIACGTLFYSLVGIGIAEVLRRVKRQNE